MSVIALKRRRQGIILAAKAIIDTANQEDRKLTDAEVETLDGHKAEARELAERIERLAEWSELAADVQQTTEPTRVDLRGHQTSTTPGPNEFRTLGEQLQAVRAFYTSGGQVVDPRLMGQRAITGLGETVAADGGFLLQPTFSPLFLSRVHDTGVFSSRVRQLPVGANSNSGMIYGIDETSRATGSRWGGIRGYRVAEGGTLTGSKPKFREINWRLDKYGVLVYASDELLQDTVQLQAIINQGATEELDFMVNDDIFRGTGAGMPMGILNSPALISVTKETGQTAATIVYENLVKMWARLDARSKANAVWFINTDCTPELDNLALAVGTGALPANYITYGPSGVMQIKGRPVVETEFNATLGTVGDIVLADMSQYLFWDKDVAGASSIHVEFLTDQTVFRFIYRADGQPAVSAPLTPYQGTDTTSPFVALASRV